MLRNILGPRSYTSRIAQSFQQQRRSASYDMSQPNILIYLLRRDLRLEDNPVFHEIVTSQKHGFTQLLPVYVFAAQQLEVSGFIPSSSSQKSPYPEARSSAGSFWRCGPHRAKFLGESVYDLKEKLRSVGSDLDIRVGMINDVVSHLIRGFNEQGSKVGGVWMTSEEGVEEKREEKQVRSICQKNDADFKLFHDEKYFIDDRDIPFDAPKDLPDVFTTYRKMVEPLREAPRHVLPTPDNLLPLPEKSAVPPQQEPFVIPDSAEEVQKALLRPLENDKLIYEPPSPVSTPSAHPFVGGAKEGHARIKHLCESGSMTSYKATRNGLLGTDFSTKLSAWLALGCITARQVHEQLLDFENGAMPSCSGVSGYNEGENDGTKAVRFELLWRDYMRLCTRKFGHLLFRVSGFRQDENMTWRYNDNAEVDEIVKRFLNGTTGMGLIDASQRELYLTGYTSNRARQNVASFLAKHLNIDWRIGAEWYESMLIDYDVSSNWGNWQYVAGVGNDPRGEARVFNPVKQAWDYDSRGEYIRAWVKELDDAYNKLQEGDGRDAMSVAEVLQAWEMPAGQRRTDAGLDGIKWVEEPLKKINFTVGKKAPHGRNNQRGGGYRGGSERTGGEKGMGRSGGYTSTRGGYGRAGYGSGGGGGYNGRGYATKGRGGWRKNNQGAPGGGGREFRTGMMDKAGMPGGEE